MSKKKKEIYLVFTILLIGAVLRLVKLGQVPPGPYLDEVLYGLDAKSVLETSKDVYGHTLPLAFQSVGYVPPIYNYVLVPFIAVFGLSAWVIRLPSAIAGILTILLTYLVTKEIVAGKKILLASISSALVAFSIWNIHFSRVAFIAGFGMILPLAGIYLFLKSKKKRSFIVLSALSFGLATQVHHDGYKLISPLIFASLVGLHWRFFKGLEKKLVAAVAFIWIAAIFVNWISFHFYNAGFRAHALLDLKPTGLVLEYLKTFSPQFLFISGDTDLMRNPVQAGEISLVLAPFLLLGLTQFKKLTSEGKATLLIWLLVAPIPSALAGYGDHALRNSLLIVPLSIICALGAGYIVNKSTKSKVFRLILVFSILAFSFQLFSQLDYYFVKYPMENALLWGEKDRQTAKFGIANASKYDRIVFVDSYSSMLSFWSFHENLQSVEIQNAILRPQIFEGLPVRRIGKFYFVPMEEEKSKDWWAKMPKGTLVVDSHFYLVGENFIIVKMQGNNLYQYLEVN